MSPASPRQHEHIDLLSLMPDDTPQYMFEAWIGALMFAIGQPEIMAQFQRETGVRWVPPRNGIERMIDESTGHSQQVIEAFIKWANVHVWGPLDADPDASRASAEREK